MILENGSKERAHVATQAYPGAGRSQVEGGRPAVGEGMELPEVWKHLEVSEATYHRWRTQFGGMKADDVKRLKELEAENTRLKWTIADQVLENQARRDAWVGDKVEVALRAPP
jgi:putative transposase